MWPKWTGRACDGFRCPPGYSRDLSNTLDDSLRINQGQDMDSNWNKKLEQLSKSRVQMRRFGFYLFTTGALFFYTDILTEIPGRATFRFFIFLPTERRLLDRYSHPRFPAEIPGRQLRASATRARRGGERQRYAVRFSSERWRRHWDADASTEARAWTRYGGRKDTADTPS